MISKNARTNRLLTLTSLGLLCGLTLGPLQWAHGEVISNGGSDVPSTNILTGDSTEGNLGQRPIEWAGTKSPARGQSFTIPGAGDYTVEGIWVRAKVSEDFSLWTANSLSLKLLGDPDTRSTTSLGDFDYDATGLGTVNVGDWLRLGLDSGVLLSAGTEYSFLLSPGELNTAHRFDVTRQKTSNVYEGGSELNAANLYDRVNWDTDPWGDLDADPSVGTSGSNLFFYIEGVPAVAIPEPSTLVLAGLGLLGLGIFGRHRRKRAA